MARPNGVNEGALREEDREQFDPFFDPLVTKDAKPRVDRADQASNAPTPVPSQNRVDRPAPSKVDEPTRFDFDLFCAMIAAMYGRHGLCPPVRLRHFAADLVADGISREHCLTVIERHLREHAASRSSGSADGLLPYLDKLIRFEWSKQATGRAHRRQERREMPRHGNSLDEYTTRSRARKSSMIG